MAYSINFFSSGPTMQQIAVLKLRKKLGTNGQEDTEERPLKFKKEINALDERKWRTSKRENAKEDW
jgi:hypothetical protein